MLCDLDNDANGMYVNQDVGVTLDGACAERNQVTLSALASSNVFASSLLDVLLCAVSIMTSLASLLLVLLPLY